MIVNPVSVDMVINFYFDGIIVVVVAIEGVAPVFKVCAVNAVFFFTFLSFFRVSRILLLMFLTCWSSSSVPGKELLMDLCISL